MKVTQHFGAVSHPEICVDIALKILEFATVSSLSVERIGIIYP